MSQSHQKIHMSPFELVLRKLKSFHFHLEIREALKMADDAKPLFIVVHGVGNQLPYSTVKHLIDGSTAEQEIPSTKTRAAFADEVEKRGIIEIDGLPFVLDEFNYSDTIERHRQYAEQDVRVWIRSFRNRLKDLDAARVVEGQRKNNFIDLENVVDDVLFANSLLRLVAERMKLQTSSINLAVVRFLQQVQLYIDRSAYREELNLDFNSFIKSQIQDPVNTNRRFHLICHSLGTVVAMRSLLDSAAKNEEWVQRVDKIVTFGSPIDLILLLFREFFQPVDNYQGIEIEWTNYSYQNDPISTDLAIARQWVEENAKGLFVKDAPDEVDLGPGSMVSAHTDYWNDSKMQSEINSIDCKRDGTEESQTEEGENRNGQPQQFKYWRAKSGSVFRTASLAASMIVGWILLMWWEENIKLGDDQRLALLTFPISQLVIWAFFTMMVVFHVFSWSLRRDARLFASIGCFFFTIFLVAFLPGIRVLGFYWEEFESVGQHFKLEGARPWTPGNCFLFLVPLSAFCGAISDYHERGRSKKKGTILFLVVITIVMSLLLGTRDNPSNITSEFTLLGLAFALWWLSILLGRIDRAYRSFIGGRDHLEICKNVGEFHRLRDNLDFRKS